MSLTIWCNAALNERAEQLLVDGLDAHRVIFAKERLASVLKPGKSDEGLAEADVVFGQPEAAECLQRKKIKWVAVTSAGYGRYDTPEFLENFKVRVGVYDEFDGVCGTVRAACARDDVGAGASVAGVACGATRRETVEVF